MNRSQDHITTIKFEYVAKAEIKSPTISQYSLTRVNNERLYTTFISRHIQSNISVIPRTHIYNSDDPKGLILNETDKVNEFVTMPGNDETKVPYFSIARWAFHKG